MRPYTEAPPQAPTTDRDRPPLQRMFGQAEPEFHDEPSHLADTAEARTADPTLPKDQRYVAEQTADQPSTDQQATIDEPGQQDPASGAPAADEPTADPQVSEPSTRDKPVDLKPGDAPLTPVADMWAENSAQHLRDRWREAQLRFVDDPRAATGDARNLVDEAVQALTAALASHREQLNSSPTDGDTEQYRMVVQRYRTFFERLLTF
jgi:hypothetical protein